MPVPDNLTVPVRCEKGTSHGPLHDTKLIGQSLPHHTRRCDVHAQHGISITILPARPSRNNPRQASRQSMIRNKDTRLRPTWSSYQHLEFSAGQKAHRRQHHCRKELLPQQALLHLDCCCAVALCSSEWAPLRLLGQRRVLHEAWPRPREL